MIRCASRDVQMRVRRTDYARALMRNLNDHLPGINGVRSTAPASFISHLVSAELLFLYEPIPWISSASFFKCSATLLGQTSFS